MALKVIAIPIKVLIGILATIVTVPIMLIAMGCVMSGYEEKGDWLLEHSPLSMWFDYVGRK